MAAALARRVGRPHAPRLPPSFFPPQDYGYPQSTSTEMLKMYVHNEPIAVEALRGGIAQSKKTISAQAVQKPISLGMTVRGAQVTAPEPS